MQFSVNYSPPLAELVREGRVQVDRFKCPAWPAMLAEAQQVLPVYIHFGLIIGSGTGAYDSEVRAPADLDRLADFLDSTGTPQINTHFIAASKDHPGIPLRSRDLQHARRVIDAARRDLEPLIERFGPERVMVENVIDEHGWLTLCVLPEVMHTLLEETGCGFLLDLSHARLAARNLGLPERSYAASLPVERLREAHITGLQRLEGRLLELVQEAGDPYGYTHSMTGRDIDHVPMADADWPELTWMMAQIQSGAWAAPWTVAFEYGGVGKFWEDITKAEVYLEQLPRMAKLVRPSG